MSDSSKNVFNDEFSDLMDFLPQLIVDHPETGFDQLFATYLDRGEKFNLHRKYQVFTILIYIKLIEKHRFFHPLPITIVYFNICFVTGMEKFK